MVALMMVSQNKVGQMARMRPQDILLVFGVSKIKVVGFGGGSQVWDEDCWGMWSRI